MYRYFENNKIFPNNQYGFRRGLSTSHAITDLVLQIEKLKAMNRRFAVVLIDFSKAFDLIDHGILFRKLGGYGFTKSAVDMVKSYLTGREQYVEVNNNVSCTLKCLPLGCPQGSCLGPLLYLIYTTDLKKLLDGHYHIMYADDTCLVLDLTEAKDELKTIRTKLLQIKDHFSNLGLKMNLAKTEILHSHMKETKINLSSYLEAFL